MNAYFLYLLLAVIIKLIWARTKSFKNQDCTLPGTSCKFSIKSLEAFFNFHFHFQEFNNNLPSEFNLWLELPELATRNAEFGKYFWLKEKKIVQEIKTSILLLFLGRSIYLPKWRLKSIYLILIKSEYTYIKSWNKTKKKLNNSFEWKENSGISV